MTWLSIRRWNQQASRYGSFVVRDLKFSEHCWRGFESSGMWRRVAAWFLRVVSKDRVASNFNGTQSMKNWTDHPWRWGRQYRPKRRKPLTQQHSSNPRRPEASSNFYYSSYRSILSLNLVMYYVLIYSHDLHKSTQMKYCQEAQFCANI